MQDDLLMDKSKTQPQPQQQRQQQQQPQPEPSTAEAPSTPLSSETPKPEDSSAVPALSPAAAPPAPNGPDKMQMESPLLPGLGFHQPPQQPPPPPQEPAAPGASLSPSFGSTWSTGTTNAVEDSFFQGITPVNGTMLFQNFPHHVNPVFGGTFSPQIGLAQTQHHQQPPPPAPQPAQPAQPPQAQPSQQRRSPASPSQAPYAQRGATAAYGHQPIMTSKPSSSSAAAAAAAAAAASSASSSWSTHQSVNAAWSAPSNPWGGLQAGRDPRRAVGVGVGVGVGVPSPLNPISPLKKPFSSNVIAPPKFPRAAPLTSKSWMEDNAFRTDNGNNLLPFQVLASLIAISILPLPGKLENPLSIAEKWQNQHLTDQMDWIEFGFLFFHPWFVNGLEPEVFSICDCPLTYERGPLLSTSYVVSFQNSFKAEDYYYLFLLFSKDSMYGLDLKLETLPYIEAQVWILRVEDYILATASKVEFSAIGSYTLWVACSVGICYALVLLHLAFISFGTCTAKYLHSSSVQTYFKGKVKYRRKNLTPYL
ncbi:hypothetical protein FD754_012643 [Muntiacus muntjak]|uniref:Uncharacterized protein n=1 Tax=Muntiacus muntjak TaxID=9888 RepID=A0A5N3VI54_MUNMU|nr:hypothetical protein FD754_012643 [Muntiacus muntjak]